MSNRLTFFFSFIKLNVIKLRWDVTYLDIYVASRHQENAVGERYRRMNNISELFLTGNHPSQQRERAAERAAEDQRLVSDRH